MTALPEPDPIVLRHLVADARYLWPTLRAPKPEPAEESWIDCSEVYDDLSQQLRVLKRRALFYAESQCWDPLYYFRPRRCDWPGVILLAQSGDLAVRVIDGVPRYHITFQGRATLDVFRFMRA